MTANPAPKLEALEQAIGFEFNEKQLLKQALTHSSAVKSKGAHCDPSSYNERLEFFGDSVLKFMVSEYLYAQYPQYSEGDLSKLRSKIISDKFLAEMAKEISLGEYLHLSYGEQKSGGKKRLSLMADAFEAVLGACYLDQGMDCTKRFFFKLFHSVDHRVSDDEFEDFKTILQERCQLHRVSLPQYRVLKEIGPEHEKQFMVEALADFNDTGVFIAQGQAETKKKAEQLAAKQLLKLLNDAGLK